MEEKKEKLNKLKEKLESHSYKNFFIDLECSRGPSSRERQLKLQGVNNNYKTNNCRNSA